MRDYIWNIDTENVTKLNNLQYTITGWLVSKDQSPFVVKAFLFPENYELSAAVKWVQRPDVSEKYSFSKGNLGPGFIIQVDGIDDSKADNQQRLRIEVQIGAKSICLIEKSIEELKKNFEDNVFSYSVDNISVVGDRLVLEGWAYSCHGHISYSLLSDNDIIEDFYLERVLRQDINKLYQNHHKEKTGFKISVNRECLSLRRLYIQINDGMHMDKITIDLTKYKLEQKLLIRLWKMLRPSCLKTTWNLLKERGWNYMSGEIQKGIHPELTDYEIWLKKIHLPTKKELNRQRKVDFKINPKFSIVIPLYNTKIEYLKEMLDSVLGQTYRNFELCLADGSTMSEVEDYIRINYGTESRIKYKRLSENHGISANTNEAINMATGDYIILSDHDDILTLDALHEVAKKINEHPEAEILYTDEDKVSMDGKRFYSPNFKPDFNIDYLRSTNYICHIFVVKKCIVDAVGMLQSEYDGAQDYDFILRCCEKTNSIFHIPKILYHWRAHQGSTAGNPKSKQYAIDAGKKALEAHYRRVGIEADVEYTDTFIIFKTIPKIIGDPKVSIVISSKDHVDDLDKCIQSIEKKTTWNNYEIIIVENNSEEERTWSYYEDIQKQYNNVKVVYWQDEFNYSAINNFGVSFAEGEYVVLLNNDIEVITPEWLQYMLGFCQREDVAIVGSKLLYPDDTVQHCGAVIGLGGFAGHILVRYDNEEAGPYGYLKAARDVSAVTAACMMIKKSIFEQVGGLEESFKVALNDMDFCLRVRNIDKLIVFNPWAELYHYESKSRGLEDAPEKVERFKNEIQRFRKRWNDLLECGDPYYNPNLTLKYVDCSVRFGREKYDMVE